MKRLKFDVFGRRIDVEAADEGWVAYFPGPDGTRRRADFAIPSGLDAEGVARYLDDVFHEAATTSHPAVRRL